MNLNVYWFAATSKQLYTLKRLHYPKRTTHTSTRPHYPKQASLPQKDFTISKRLHYLKKTTLPQKAYTALVFSSSKYPYLSCRHAFEPTNTTCFKHAEERKLGTSCLKLGGFSENEILDLYYVRMLYQK
jgi:hypothetical protein